MTNSVLAGQNDLGSSPAERERAAAPLLLTNRQWNLGKEGWKRVQCLRLACRDWEDKIC